MVGPWGGIVEGWSLTLIGRGRRWSPTIGVQIDAGPDGTCWSRLPVGRRSKSNLEDPVEICNIAVWESAGRRWSNETRHGLRGQDKLIPRITRGGDGSEKRSKGRSGRKLKAMKKEEEGLCTRAVDGGRCVRVRY